MLVGWFCRWGSRCPGTISRINQYPARVQDCLSVAPAVVVERRIRQHQTIDIRARIETQDQINQLISAFLTSAWENVEDALSHQPGMFGRVGPGVEDVRRAPAVRLFEH